MLAVQIPRLDIFVLCQTSCWRDILHSETHETRSDIITSGNSVL